MNFLNPAAFCYLPLGKSISPAVNFSTLLSCCRWFCRKGAGREVGSYTCSVHPALQARCPVWSVYAQTHGTWWSYQRSICCEFWNWKSNSLALKKHWQNDSYLSLCYILKKSYIDWRTLIPKFIQDIFKTISSDWNLNTDTNKFQVTWYLLS